MGQHLLDFCPKFYFHMTWFKIPGTFPGQIGCFENVLEFTKSSIFGTLVWWVINRQPTPKTQNLNIFFYYWRPLLKYWQKFTHFSKNSLSSALYNKETLHTIIFQFFFVDNFHSFFTFFWLFGHLEYFLLLTERYD